MELPDLPEPTLEDHPLELWGQNVASDLFTADQMRAYAAQAVAEERERCIAAMQNILHASDIEMEDGDFAREIAKRFLTESGKS